MSDIVEKLLHRAKTMNGSRPVGCGDGGTFVSSPYRLADRDLDVDAINEITLLRAALVEERKRALEEAAKALETDGANGLERRICCDGQMCGCYGSTVGEYAAHVVRSLMEKYDQDPRYGWADIHLQEGKDEILVIVHDESGSHGFIYRDGSMKPTCLCNAWSEDECGCGNYGKDTAT